MIEKNPAARVKMFPEPPGRNNFLTTEEAGRLLDACLPHLRPIVLCALETGMRRAEILGLKWSDIRNGMIYLTADRTKNGKPREIPVSRRLTEELIRLRNRRRLVLVKQTRPTRLPRPTSCSNPRKSGRH